MSRGYLSRIGQVPKTNPNKSANIVIIMIKADLLWFFLVVYVWKIAISSVIGIKNTVVYLVAIRRPVMKEMGSKTLVLFDLSKRASSVTQILNNKRIIPSALIEKGR